MTGEPLPVTVIGGYLGAGKTTMVNHLLRNAGGRRLAVLVNEFGELPIDEDLIEAEGDNLISIAGGCVCCSFGSDLTAALIQMAQMDPRPDHVVIESSGVAIPGAILLTVSLIDGFRPDGTVVLADAPQLRRAAVDPYIGDTILRQLRDANIVLMNKSDLLGETELEALDLWLADTAPQAARIPSIRGAVAIEAVLGLGAEPLASSAGGHADKLFDSIVLRPAAPVDCEALAARIAEGPYGVVRAKGYLRERQGGVRLIHVAGNRWEVTPGPDDARPGLVCIGLREGFDGRALVALADSA